MFWDASQNNWCSSQTYPKRRCSTILPLNPPYSPPHPPSAPSAPAALLYQIKDPDRGYILPIWSFWLGPTTWYQQHERAHPIMGLKMRSRFGGAKAKPRSTFGGAFPVFPSLSSFNFFAALFESFLSKTKKIPTYLVPALHDFHVFCHQEVFTLFGCCCIFLVLLCSRWAFLFSIQLILGY